ncbi:MAG: hypothetical protein O3A51_03245 [Verrucomicrobia bacterium]|nr:hypothetical protein [Verrucomicrobiota bacterium]
MDFAEIVDLTIEEEGGFVNDPNDKGGATKYGISLSFLQLIDPASTQADIIAMTHESAREVYRYHFWDTLRAGELPSAYALLAFDMAVNSGVGDAAKSLQAAIGAFEDGIIGSMSVALAQAQPVTPASITAFTSRRILHLYEAAAWDRYGKGWVARTLRMHNRALEIMRHG